MNGHLKNVILKIVFELYDLSSENSENNVSIFSLYQGFDLNHIKKI